jgi:YD repeat-containing protein
MTNACPPPAAAQETCLACASAAAGHPISLASGNTYIVETDVKIPGLSGGLALVRTWNSLWPSTQTAYQVGLFGPNWRSNYEERIFVGSDNYIKYARGDGNFWSFGYSSGNTLRPAAPANVNATLVYGPTYWTLTFQDGEQRLFEETAGKLVEIIDRNGNSTQLTYDSVGRLVTVTDPTSRHLYFGYGSGSSLLVTSVTSDAGISLTYAYDTQGRLITVTEPDLSTLNFQYNSQSLITAVTDSNGKIFESHTYDSSGRGLTSSRANGVDAVTVTYPN